MWLVYIEQILTSASLSSAEMFSYNICPSIIYKQNMSISHLHGSDFVPCRRRSVLIFRAMAS